MTYEIMFHNVFHEHAMHNLVIFCCRAIMDAYVHRCCRTFFLVFTRLMSVKKIKKYFVHSFIVLFQSASRLKIVSFVQQILTC